SSLLLLVLWLRRRVAVWNRPLGQQLLTFARRKTVMHNKALIIAALIVIASCSTAERLHAQDLGTEGYVDSRGVKLHYVTAGEAPHETDVKLVRTN
ncbi:MAG: hypothetical protein ABI614_26060, partial [Planctomycetota bacterium]